MDELDLGFLNSLTGYWLKQANYTMLAGADQLLAPVGVTAPQFSLLALIHANPGIIQSRLIENSYISRSTSSELIEKLVNAGLVVREPIDRRSNGLYVSEKGRQAVVDGEDIVQKHEAEAVSHLSGKETDELKRLLKKLTRP